MSRWLGLREERAAAVELAAQIAGLFPVRVGQWRALRWRLDETCKQRLGSVLTSSPRF